MSAGFLHLKQYPDNLLGRVILSCYSVLLSKLKIAETLTLKTDQLSGGRPDLKLADLRIMELKAKR